MRDTRARLAPLTSIRFLAALHILFFHLGAAHAWQKERSSPDPLMPMYDRLPMWLENWGLHAYCSTGLFFLISGFVLAYLYIRPDGSLSTTRRRFWIARMTRIYPLHVVALILLIPVAAQSGGTLLDTTLGGVLSLLLIQAWIPGQALSWNYPTWALSVVVCFYLCFPAMVSIMRRCSHRTLIGLLTVMPLASLLPTLIYIGSGGTEEIGLSRHAPPGWTLVNYFPPLWLPHFAMGMLLARICRMSRFQPDRIGYATSGSWCMGDTAFATVVAITIVDTVAPAMMLRHGVLAPLYLVTIRDLARGHGVLARILSIPALQRLGDASFAVFILQYPAVSYLNVLRRLEIPESIPMLPIVIMLIVAASVASTRLFERPVSNWLRARLLPD